jgi:hypothetical protein
MDEQDLYKRISEYQEEVRNDESISIDMLILNILDPIAEILEIFDHKWRSPRITGVILRDSSYVACRLGATPDWGDVEYGLQVLDREYDWQDCAFSPELALSEYRRGNALEMMKFFNGLIERASEDLANLPFVSAARDTVSHGPSVWYLNKDLTPEMDIPVLDTEYHLYNSLARFVEYAVGTA